MRTCRLQQNLVFVPGNLEDEAGGLPKPQAAKHEGEVSPREIVFDGTFPPLPPAPLAAECVPPEAVDLGHLHFISETLEDETTEEPDDSPEFAEAAEAEVAVPVGRTWVLMADPTAWAETGKERARAQQACQRFECWFYSCGLLPALVARDAADFNVMARTVAEGCQSFDTCVVILTGLHALQPPEPEEAGGEESGGSGWLRDFWLALPSGVTVVLISDCDHTEFLEDVQKERLGKDLQLQLVAFSLLCPDSEPNSAWASLCSAAMLQAADALSLADGPCKLTCADFFREMTEQAEDLAAERGFEKPVAVSRGSDGFLPGMERWPLARAPREMAREIGANNMAATQTWVRTGAIPRVIEIPELHRPRPRSESPARERTAAAELAAVGASIATKAFAATATAMRERSATVAALVDAQYPKRQMDDDDDDLAAIAILPAELVAQVRAEPLSPEPSEATRAPAPKARPAFNRAQTAEVRRRRSGKAQEQVARNRSTGLRAMPQNFGGLELMLSGGGALKQKPKALAKR
ncbi:hypothetical protein AK812_SmicGene16104 [Symbiodinium microadriaticum]|uniref:Uncharacterized protein n=1 Tax=Symbiodinium microadriaticum TaxID=2951 RepID=A0A1Q9E186_SYMMI|nr:hypothetical protein AK812_SmicGene16104 [Symbiodinium microadriaticum]